ncbi:roadblock/LC7 domain-containing protein [Deinococcus sp. Marseille-Q6407]|uniref:roadblock/LC7 domain-containing protein n=1 Tax=Deinococcus sp. Marseille-Q6407 TaxID=2969223 RepID=UPI0021BF7662|nr:roadblock/LC7 domain-containing protein [Deinococcus sp. Marseille-Q6407]
MTQLLLDSLLEGRGIHAAALYGSDGTSLAEAGDVGSGPTIASLLVPARAIVQTLQQTLNAQGWNDLLLDLESGPLLLTPGQDGQVLAVAFDDLSSLGRVRLSVRRVLENLPG